MMTVNEAIVWLKTRSSWTGHSCHKVADVLASRIEELEAQLAAKDAAVEAAWKAVNKSVYPLDFLEDALRALDAAKGDGDE